MSSNIVAMLSIPCCGLIETALKRGDARSFSHLFIHIVNLVQEPEDLMRFEVASCDPRQRPWPRSQKTSSDSRLPHGIRGRPVRLDTASRPCTTLRQCETADVAAAAPSLRMVLGVRSGKAAVSLQSRLFGSVGCMQHGSTPGMHQSFSIGRAQVVSPSSERQNALIIVAVVLHREGIPSWPRQSH